MKKITQYKIVLSVVSALLFIPMIVNAASSLKSENRVCIIEGRILNDSLRYNNSRIKKVYLTAQDEFDRFYNVDSVELKRNKFKFKYELKEGEPILLHFITGFDNGIIPFVLEPGEVNIEVEKAAYPSASKVWGTENNELYAQYKAIAARCVDTQMKKLKPLVEEKGDKWMDSPEAWKVRKRIGASALITCDKERIKFLLDHNDSPIAPLLMEKEIAYMLTPTYAEQMLNALSPTLYNHPYYRSFYNYVCALDLREGGKAPNITIPLLNGETSHLADYKGKYVLLDFWASWCGPCMRELPHLKELYNQTREHSDDFVIISFSLDNEEKAWKKAIEQKEMNREGWIQASDLLGWSSPAANLFGVTMIPRIILLDPEGNVISLALRGEEMVSRVKQILDGKLDYKK